MSLFHLCDFIEDCEFTALSTQILSLVGELGPSTSAPARYIRFIYNRYLVRYGWPSSPYSPHIRCVCCGTPFLCVISACSSLLKDKAQGVGPMGQGVRSIHARTAKLWCKP